MLTMSGNSNTQTEYEIYRIPVIKALRKYINQLNGNLSSIEPILGRVFEEASSKCFSAEDKVNLKPPLILSKLVSNSVFVLNGILGQNVKFQEAKHKIETFDAIFVVGAGLSFESDVPMVTDIEDILNFIGATNYSDLRNDLEMCYNFKDQFKIIVNRKQPGISHKLIASNFPSKIKEIISLNWDDLIEKAFRDSSKPIKKINKETEVKDENYLWKFHGDVEEYNKGNDHGQLGWIFPDEDGYVFDCFKKYMNDKLDSKLFCLFVIGYSEKDGLIRKVITQIEGEPPRPTFRIGMDMGKFHDNFYLLGPSGYVLEQILR